MFRWHVDQKALSIPRLISGTHRKPSRGSAFQHIDPSLVVVKNLHPQKLLRESRKIQPKLIIAHSHLNKVLAISTSRFQLHSELLILQPRFQNLGLTANSHNRRTSIRTGTDKIQNLSFIFPQPNNIMMLRTSFSTHSSITANQIKTQ